MWAATSIGWGLDGIKRWGEQKASNHSHLLCFLEAMWATLFTIHNLLCCVLLNCLFLLLICLLLTANSGCFYKVVYRNDFRSKWFLSCPDRMLFLPVLQGSSTQTPRRSGMRIGVGELGWAQVKGSLFASRAHIYLTCTSRSQPQTDFSWSLLLPAWWSSHFPPSSYQFPASSPCSFFLLAFLPRKTID